MKKIITAILIVLVLLGCQKNKMDEKQTVQINLDGNPSTGYDWILEISDNEVMEVIKEEFIIANEQLIGSGGKYVFTMQALKPGEVTLTFRYLRIWEEVDPINEINYYFNIADNLEITLINISGNYNDQELPQPVIK